MALTSLEDVCAFDEATHTYTRNGVVLPSVTGIIERCLPRTDNAPAEMIEGARLRGEWVDKHLAEYLTSGAVTVDADAPGEYQGCLEKAIDWWEHEIGIKPVQCQLRLIGEKEAGTADFLVCDDFLLDLKSTYQISNTVQVQLGGYIELYRELTGSFVKKAGILHTVKRLKSAVFKEFNVVDCVDDWTVVRDFHRRFCRPKERKRA